MKDGGHGPPYNTNDEMGADDNRFRFGCIEVRFAPQAEAHARGLGRHCDTALRISQVRMAVGRMLQGQHVGSQSAR